jgi:predicted TIM-barrel fold metal-dependent hydrolase
VSIDLDHVVGIDTHVHAEVDDHGHTALPQPFLDASAAYFKAGERTPSIDQIGQRYRALRLAAVIFTVDAERKLGHRRIRNEDVVASAQRHPDVFIPFASIDPAKGDEGVAELRELIAGGAVKGLKLHPSLQEFAPNDGTADGLYALLAEHRMPVIFHTGQTGIGAGMPGGGGIKLRYSDPMLVDDVCADFPDLTVILAHGSVPWHDAAISIARHKPNAFIDLSGWSPKYFPPQLVRAMNGGLRRKVLFATDNPVIDPERWLADFATLELEPGVRELVMKDNAARILGLTQEDA